MTEGSTLQEDITILNMHVPNNTVLHNSVRQKLIELKGETDKSTITVVDFNTPPPKMERFSRQKNQ